MKHIKTVLGLLMLLAAAVLFGLRIKQAQQDQEAAAKKAGKKAGAQRIVAVSTAQSRIGRVRQEILLTGALRPKEQVEVTAKATGRIERLSFQLGDLVKQGDLIAVLEDDELEQQVKRATASLAVVRASTRQRSAERENSRANLARAESLLKEGLLARTDYESRKTAFEVVQAQIQLAEAQEGQAQAEINELKIRLAQTRILAPMTGLVSRRYVDEGALVGPSTPIMTLVNLNTMVTQASVPEQEVGKLRVGAPAIVSVDAFGDQSFSGRVARISPVLDPATRSATVEVEIPNRDGSLKAEMFARVMLDLGTMRDAVLIPREALVYRGTQPGVFVADRNRSSFRAVDAGRTLGEDVEVLGNLEPGVTVVARGSTMLREGDQIRVAGQGTRASAGGDSGAAAESAPEATAEGVSKKGGKKAGKKDGKASIESAAANDAAGVSGQ